jgi:hypothetical protein
MNRHSLHLFICAALLAGFAGTARAELNESALPNQAQAKVNRPATVARAGHSAFASRRVLAERTTTPLPQSEPVCGWFSCDQYLVVGIGF